MENPSINRHRRRVLRAGSGATLGTLLVVAGWLPAGAQAADGWNKTAFETHSLDDTLHALGSNAPAAQSKDIVFFSTPDIAENGAVVPIGVTSNVPGTQSIAILIEKNPNTLAAVFDIPAGTDPSVSTRVKMAQTSNV